MIHLLDLGKPHILGLRIDGKIDRAAAKDIFQTIETRFESGRRFCIYIEVADSTDFEWSAAREALNFAFTEFRPYIRYVYRLAIISDDKTVRKLTGMDNKFLPDSVTERAFSYADAEQAREWVSEVDAHIDK